MEPHQSPDSTVSNDGSEEFVATHSQPSQLWSHHHERRVSSSSNRFLSTPSSGGSGTAPRLLLKATGSGSFQSTPVGNDTERTSSVPPVRQLPRLIFTGNKVGANHHIAMGSSVQSTSGEDPVSRFEDETVRTPRLIFKGGGLPSNTIIPRGLEVTPVQVNSSNSGFNVSSIEKTSDQQVRRAPKMKINRGFSSSSNLNNSSFHSRLIEDPDPVQDIPIRAPPKLLFTGAIRPETGTTHRNFKFSKTNQSFIPDEPANNIGIPQLQRRAIPKVKTKKKMPPASSETASYRGSGVVSQLNRIEFSSDGSGQTPKLMINNEGRRNSLLISHLSKGVPSGESPLESRDPLQKMSGLVDVSDNSVPVSLPRPRFLQSQPVRHFLNSSSRGPPPLTPLRIKKQTLTKQMLNTRVKKRPKHESEIEVTEAKETVLNDSGSMKESQSRLMVSSSSTAQPGIKLHIRRGVETSVDNSATTNQDLIISNSISDSPVNSNLNLVETNNSGSCNSSLNVDNEDNYMLAEKVQQTNNLIADDETSNNLQVPEVHPSNPKTLSSGRKVKKSSTPEQVSDKMKQKKMDKKVGMKIEKNSNTEPVESESSKVADEVQDDNTHTDADKDGNARRTQRKRKPTKHYMTDMVVPRIKVRRKKDNIEEEVEKNSAETVDEIKSDSVLSESSPDFSPTMPRGRGRGRGTGRGRGRPRGSALKRKVDRLSLPIETAPVVEQEVQPPPSETPEPISPVVINTELPLEGDSEVNDNLRPENLQTPTKPRGRSRARGSRARGSKSGRGARGSLKSEKKKSLPVPEIKESPPAMQIFEEETRMSADIRCSPEKPILPSSITCTPLLIQDEESRASNSNVSSTSVSNNAIKTKKFTKDFIDERKPVTADTIYEYQWPQNDSKADYYFLQEQITEFLGMKSFRRKYPDLKRRVVEMEERDFLRQQKIVSETQCDLGLTAINSTDVLDVLFNDFPEKYEQYNKVIHERREKDLAKLKAATIPGPITCTRDRTVEFITRIQNSCSNWNATFNRERKEDRSCSFDLQTGTLNYPKNKMLLLPSESTKIGHYPVAVLSGQYCDDYKRYTSTELSYMPLNTVIFGPVLANTVDSDDSGSDSDSSSSSDESSSSSSDEDCRGIGKHQIGMDESTNDLMMSFGEGMDTSDSQGVCRTCNGDAFKNKDSRQEVLIHCAKCDVANHPTCLDLSLDMVPFIRKYNWQCNDCKNCIECNDSADEDKMLFCDCCDRGYHIYCVGLRKVPNGRWHCGACSVCHSCGSTVPAPDDRVAEWHHEFKKGEKGFKYFLHSLCVSCHKIYKKGQYCPSCLKCHLKTDDKNLLECRNCEKWVHKHCVKRPLQTMFGFMCDTCHATFKARTKLPSQRN